MWSFKYRLVSILIHSLIENRKIWSVSTLSVFIFGDEIVLMCKYLDCESRAATECILRSFNLGITTFTIKTNIVRLIHIVSQLEFGFQVPEL